ncbi:unnamed protein product [Caenorhabditis brenneri]
MSATPMSLESLQFLLKYMDANRRFEISNRCPALRAIERSVPLKIESLTLMGHCVHVNDTSYKLGIIRKYHNGEAPDYVTASNEEGGLFYEVDRFGIRDQLDKYTVTPGDVEIKPDGEPWIPDEEFNIGSLENQLQHYEERLAQQREREPLRNRRNVDHEAMKQLTTVLFGDRSFPIYVTKFKFVCSRGVVRLPIDLKFHIGKLMLERNVGKTLEALAPIIHESSFPLKKLAINLFSVDDVTNPIVQAAQTLRAMIISMDVMPIVSAITNLAVCIVMVKLSERTLEEIIGNWIESKRPIGTEHVICLLHREPRFVDEMEDILKRFNGVPIDDENVIVPMSDDAHLKISYGPFPEFAPRCKWAVKLLNQFLKTMSTTLMSLECLKFLLQYMDANRRFEISNRCPAFRAIEKSVPLKIKSLIFRESCVIVNDTKYKIGVIQKYNVGEAPDYVKAINKRGGLPHEVDIYGIIDESDALTVTPGDVTIQSGGDRRIENEDARRSSPINVKKFTFFCSQGVIRLPIGLKFHIEQLIIGGDVRKTLEALAPIIYEPSFPLKKLDITLSSVEDATNPIVQTSGSLSIILLLPDILQLITAITNPMARIIVMMLSEQTFEEFVRNWIQSKRPIGTEHTICLLRSELWFEYEMEDILKRLNGVPIDDENAIIPMSVDAHLKISYGPFPEFAPLCNWAVKFVTEAIQHG